MKISDEYAAGFFDGEGTVGMYKNGLSSYRLQALVVQKNPAVLCEFQEKYGGIVSGPSNGKYTWSASSSSNIHQFLLAIRPYVIEKAAQVELAIQYLESIKQIGGGYGSHHGIPLAVGEFERRQSIANELKRLKRIS